MIVTLKEKADLFATGKTTFDFKYKVLSPEFDSCRQILKIKTRNLNVTVCSQAEE